MLIRRNKNKALYDELFAHGDPWDDYTPKLPSEQELRDALSDPAARAKLGTNIAQRAFVRRASQEWLQVARIQAFEITQNIGILDNVNLGDFGKLFGGIQTSGFAQTNWRSLATNFRQQGIRVALDTMSAVPVVGAIAQAIVNIGSLIYEAINAIDKTPELVKLPLQEPSAETDASQVNDILRGHLSTRDLTQVFMPRFVGDWHVQIREGGFAFARGFDGWERRRDGGWEQPRFTVPNMGPLGFIPGGQQVTSVIQVQTPRGWSYGHVPDGAFGRGDWGEDVGGFYGALNSAVVALWTNALKSSPSMYTINTSLLRDAWSDYYEAWFDKLVWWWSHTPGGRGYVGTGWRQVLLDASLQAFVSDGIKAKVPHDLLEYWNPESEIAPTSTESSVYGRIIDPACKQLKQYQLATIEHSTMAAYLRDDFGALRDLAVKHAYVSARKNILQSDLRFNVNMRDVIDKEYRQALLDAGVKPGNVGYDFATPTEGDDGGKKIVKFIPQKDRAPLPPRGGAPLGGKKIVKLVRGGGSGAAFVIAALAAGGLGYWYWRTQRRRRR